MLKSEFYHYIYEKAQAVYKDQLNEFEGRISYEIDRVEALGLVHEFLAAELLIKSYKKKEIVYIVRGSVGALCISYLLGITEVDPIEYEIPCEMALGEDGHKLPQFEIVHDGTGLFKTSVMSGLIRKRNFVYDAKESSLALSKNNLLVWKSFAEGNYPSDIGLDCENMANVLKAFKPGSIRELAKAISIALGDGIMNANAQTIIKGEPLCFQDIPSTREDLYTMLLEYGIPIKIAYSIVNYVRTGRGIPSRYAEYINNSKLPAWLIPYCDLIQYMLPRSYCLELANLAYKIVKAECYD